MSDLPYLTKQRWACLQPRPRGSGTPRAGAWRALGYAGQ